MPVGLVERLSENGKNFIKFGSYHVRSIFFKMADTTSNAINWIDFPNPYY